MRPTFPLRRLLPAQRGDRAVFLAGVFAGLALLAWRAAPYFTGHAIFFHDNLPLLSYFTLHFGSLLDGRLPLWAPEIDAGQPLWPIVEIAIGLDPIALLSWLVAHVAGASALIALQLAFLGWLLVFAWGGVALARRLTRDPWILAAIFIVLAAGPLWLASPAQGYGYVLPFRYTPWILLIAVHALERPGMAGGALLGLLTGISLAGYQTVYAAVCAILALGVYACVRARLGWRPRLEHGKALLAAAVLFVPILLPTFLAVYHAAQALHVYPRDPVFSFIGAYQFSRGKLWYDMIATRSGDGWHGSAAIGPGLLVLLLAGAAAALWPLRRKRSSAPRTAWGAVWLVTTPAVVLLACFQPMLHPHWGDGTAPSQATLLGARNWGFALTFVLLGLTQLAALAHERLRRVLAENRRRARLIAGAAFGLVVVVMVATTVLNALDRDFFDRCHGLVMCDGAVLRRGYAIRILLAALPMVIALAASDPARRRLPLLWPPLVMVLTVCFLALRVSPGIVYRDPASAISRAPPVTALRARFPESRQGRFDAAGSYPFLYEGPALRGAPVADMPPNIRDYQALPIEGPVPAILHVFDLPRYYRLIAASVPPDVTARLLAVDGKPAWLARQAALVASPDEAVTALQQASAATIAERPVIEAGAGFAQAEGAAEGKVDVLSYSGATARFRVDSATAGLLVFADGYDRDWRAKVDGREAPLWPANLVAKAVPVPAGMSEVVLTYRPWPYILAYCMRAAVLTAAALALVIHLLRRARYPTMLRSTRS